MSMAQRRLMKEYEDLQRAPVPLIEAKPDDKNILTWHFIMLGAPETPFEGGEYYGCIYFPSIYPHAPPDFIVFTPNGRFQPGAKICMSNTGFHKESWNPLWGVKTMLLGLQSFMTGSDAATGAIFESDENKTLKAKESWKWNRNNKDFRTHFPERLELEQ